MILLFGASGQLGQALQAEACRTEVEIDPASFTRCDIADLDAVNRVFGSSRARVVVNAAAFTAVDRAEIEEGLAERTNAEGAELIAGVAKEAGLPLIHISTDYVFDGTKESPYREDDVIAPIGAYGRSKANGEMLVGRRNPKHLILRTAWLYSRYGTNFLKTMVRLASSRPELRVVCDQFGTPTSAADLAEAIVAVVVRLSTSDFSDWGTYHYAGAGTTTWHGLACRIVDAQAAFTGLHPPVVPISTEEYRTAVARPRNSALDTSRFSATFGIGAKRWASSVDRDVRSFFERNG